MAPVYGTLARVAARCALLGMLWSVPSFAVDCTPEFVPEAQSRCTTEASTECVLITWFINDMPVQCRLVGSTLAWWAGVPTTGTAIDPSSGQLILIYTFKPLALMPSAPTGVGVS